MEPLIALVSAKVDPEQLIASLAKNMLCPLLFRLQGGRLADAWFAEENEAWPGRNGIPGYYIGV
jgi:hypothetical protein